MLEIECPYCGKRAETEFTWGGEANVTRPRLGNPTTDQAWADYLFFRDNKKGEVRERWRHVHGCRQWFILVRSTTDHTIIETSAIDAQDVNLEAVTPTRRLS